MTKTQNLGEKVRNIFLVNTYRVLIPIFTVCFLMINTSTQARAEDEKTAFLLGGGLGLGGVSNLRNGGFSGSGLSTKGHFGVTFSSGHALMLEYEVQRINTGDSKLGDWLRGTLKHIQTSQPIVFKSTYVLTSFQMNLYKGLYLRPGFGVAMNKCTASGNPGTPALSNYAKPMTEVCFAYGVSAGYGYKVSRYLTLGLEAVFRKSTGKYMISPNRDFDMRLTFSWQF